MRIGKLYFKHNKIILAAGSLWMLCLASLLKFSLGDVMKLKLVGVCLQLARDLGTEVVGANSDQGRVDQTSVGGGDGVWSGNSVGKGSTVGENLGFSISITLAIVSVSVWVSISIGSVAIWSVSIVSIESISISLWFSISITLAIVSVSVDSSMVWEPM